MAVAPGETEEETTRRWQQWFQGMNVHPHGIALLEQARADGVGDIPSLRKWLKRVARTGQYTAVSSLHNVLNRLMANRSLREWLEWPTNRFDVLPQGALFFACKGDTWARDQLLRAVLLAVSSIQNIRVIVHGYPWSASDFKMSAQISQMIVGNAPLLERSTVILTESHPRGGAMLTDQFMIEDAYLGENLELLSRGEGIIIADKDVLFTTWNGEK
ncbi:MAG: hypothetical protein GY805_26705 [Chloroflexi bacterium]|nr:hypothetical protein [Chloroflexota bacterium]